MTHKYSPTEERLLKMLPHPPNRITVNELTKLYYKKLGKAMPFHGRIYISSSMRRLMAKAKVNGDYKIVRSNVIPYQYWITTK